jgi:2'-5' RNA ligase
MHLTLQFIGNVDEAAIPVIQERLTHVAGTHDYAQLDGIDIFMKRQKVTVIFVRVAAKHLALLAQQINKQLHDFVEAESKSFVGHLTLVRVKAVEDRERLLDLLGTLVVEPVRFPIREFVLKQSVLSAQRWLHADVQVYPLLPP